VPLIINDGHAPDHWAVRNNGGPTGMPGDVSNPEVGVASLKIALINNMPDAALEDTESQFFSLLEAAADNFTVQAYLYHIPEVPRSDRAQGHIARFYRPVDELSRQRFDGAVITGTEPRQPNLRDESYWDTLTSVFDWAEQYTTSTVMSCLAAHASVLHSDGVNRQPLPEKQFGVFDFQRVSDHELTAGLPRVVQFPHSRWNELRRDSLISHGYIVLDQSTSDGVNLFVKQKQESLFVYFQGHPEYGSHTLLKEFRRDVRRFLRQERPIYPSLPHGYFDTSATSLLADFQARAEMCPTEEALSAFPEPSITNTLKSSWSGYARTIYRNWMGLMTSRKPSNLPSPDLTPSITP
jgi:homoserine O-succinyltransferase/O-acetyltransferase